MVVDMAVIAGLVFGGLLGRHEGFARALWGFTGVLAGTVLGLALVPAVLGNLDLSIWVSMAALAIVVASAVAVRAFALVVEGRFRARLGITMPAPYDAVLGAGFGVLVAIGVSWMVGLALAGSALPRVAPAVNSSRAVGLLNDMRLPLSHLMLTRFTSIGHEQDFPRYVDVFTKEKIRPVAAPPKDVVSDPEVVAASASVLKVVSRESPVTADEGTAFLVAPERMMTAAHVVDDTRGVTVESGPDSLVATVVYCDPVHDVAVLAVSGVSGSVLSFADAEADQPAASIGYPNDRPLTLRPARVRERITWQASNIWGEGRYEHDALVIRGVVRGGNSGGPLVSEAGEVLGVVVASSRADADTGYVLTADQVAPALRAANAASGANPPPVTTCQQ